MLLDFSVDWQWIVGSTDVSPFVETWELAREQPDISTPAWWRGKLVLRPVVGRNLNLDPLTNSLWRQGTNCSLNVGGSLVFTGSILLVYYDDWSTAPRLELEVGDVLAAKNHRQVIPFGKYNALSLLQTLGIPGIAPAGDRVEISTDLTSPVKVLQELTWVTWLKQGGLPATLFTRPNGQVSYASPQLEIALERTLEQVADFTRQRPALEIPGSVIASASLTYFVQPPPLRGVTGDAQAALVTKQGNVIKVTYLDFLGRVIKEESYKDRQLNGYTIYEYYADSRQYEIIKQAFIRVDRPFRPPALLLFEYTKEIGERVGYQWIATSDSDLVIYGQIEAQKKTFVYWPDWRLFPIPEDRIGYYGIFLVYIVEEYSISGRRLPSWLQQIYNLVTENPYILRLITRARGTTQDTDTIQAAATLSPAISEIVPNQAIQFPDWVKQFWDPPKPERATDVLSEGVEVVGFTGPPVYLTVPWLSVIVEDDPESRELRQNIENLRQEIKQALRAAASWMAIEIAGRAFARRIKMPVPSEWLSNPQPWMLARIGNEVFWLVGEVLRGTNQGVEFEATGILAGRPNTIPPGEFPPGMIPPTDLPPSEGQSGLFPPGTIPSFTPLVTVTTTRFPKVGIGCVMQVSEVLTVPGDPWLGMAALLEHEVLGAVTLTMVGIGVSGEDSAGGIGFAVDVFQEIADEDNGEGLTLEAEDGIIYSGFIVYDADASSCYAVQGDYPSIDVIVDSTSLNWTRPLRLRVVYKTTSEGQLYVFVLRQGSGYFLGSFDTSPTTVYTTAELVIPESEEPFDGIGIDGPFGTWIDAIQLAPATGDWPPLNPCED